VGVLYVLDEPSIGLHQRDNDRLLDDPRRGCATSGNTADRGRARRGHHPRRRLGRRHRARARASTAATIVAQRPV
jgi:hypothetical protein